MAAQARPRSTLTFQRHPQAVRFDDGLVYDADVVIAYHASRGAGCRPGDAPRWQAPVTDPLYAINGRPC